MHRTCYAYALGSLVACASCTLPDVHVHDFSGTKRRQPAAEMSRDADIAQTEDAATSHSGAESAKGGTDADAAAMKGSRSPVGDLPSSNAGAAPQGGSSGFDGADSDGGAGIDRGNGVAPARVWSTPRMMTSMVGDQMKNVQHGIDRDGRVVAIWDSELIATKASRYVDSAWSPATTFNVELQYTSSCCGTRLTVDPIGSAAVLIPHKLPLETAITLGADYYVANLLPDGEWSTPIRLDVGYSDLYQLAMNDVGSAIVAAVRIDSAANGDRWTVWSSQYDPRTGWGAIKDLESHWGGIASAPHAVDVAISHGGRGMVISTRTDGVYAQEFDEYSKQLEEWSTTTSGPRRWAAVASDDYDRSFAAWTSFDGTHTNLHSKRYVRGTGWSELTVLENNDDADVMTPRLVVDKLGNATVVWAQSDGTTTAIWYNRFELGTGWTGAKSIEPQLATSNGQAPSLAIDELGNVLAVWVDVGSVRASRYLVGSGWEPSVKVSPDGQLVETPRVSVSPSGVGMATWCDQNQTTWFSRFE